MNNPATATEHITEQRGELERTLGLSQALAIGTGTMVGAGIFGSRSRRRPQCR